jgi:hypothetical protein
MASSARALQPSPAAQPHARPLCPSPARQAAGHQLCQLRPPPALLHNAPHCATQPSAATAPHTTTHPAPLLAPPVPLLPLTRSHQAELGPRQVLAVGARDGAARADEDAVLGGPVILVRQAAVSKGPRKGRALSGPNALSAVCPPSGVSAVARGSSPHTAECRPQGPSLHASARGALLCRPAERSLEEALADAARVVVLAVGAHVACGAGAAQHGGADRGRQRGASRAAL